MWRDLKRPAAHFKTIIIDEAHRSAAATYRRILKQFTRAKVLGITATPDRTDQRALGEIFEEIAFEIGLPELIEQGYLAPVRESFSRMHCIRRFFLKESLLERD
jgi:superfamily II DNA or RNA helicase